jgi:hypothetical protein
MTRGRHHPGGSRALTDELAEALAGIRYREPIEITADTVASPRIYELCRYWLPMPFTDDAGRPRFVVAFTVPDALTGKVSEQIASRMS